MGEKNKWVTEKDGGKSRGHLVFVCMILGHMGNQGRVYEAQREADCNESACNADPQVGKIL